MDFDNNFKPIGAPTGYAWVLGIHKSPTQSLHKKLPVKPTKRQIRKEVKEYMK